MGSSLLSRVIIENIQPAVNNGRFLIKRTPGESVTVTADIYTDGHDALAAILKYRRSGDASWTEVPMTPLPNDAWTVEFTVNEKGIYEYVLEAWIDSFSTWRQGLAKKHEAHVVNAADLLEGAAWIEAAVERSTGTEASWLRKQGTLLKKTGDPASKIKAALSEELIEKMARCPDRTHGTVTESVFPVLVERERARYGAWYEMFPRSTGKETVKGGTFRDAEKRLPAIAEMGFDVLYLPPIHPIGKSFRKGPNNNPEAGPDDPGSPWAIGSSEGGHTAVHSDLGTLADFKHFVEAARKSNLEIALDLAYQCSPDHPYAREHPEWFRHRPDGSIQYAENPPKKYEDIYPFDFECAAWEALWNELRDIVLFWIDQGVLIFRVDNPHTKPFAFWEWLMREVRQKNSDVIFLAEAFTRPKIMAYLAKSGFSQSYSYFTWRTTKAELTSYFTELTQTPVREFMRPNLFANTPDIFHEFLQVGGRAAFQIRLFLAATLGASYGIYGPPFELCEARAVPGTEDYQDSEKYQIRQWDLDRPGNITEWIGKVNRARRANPALHFDHRLQFLETTNEYLLAYAKTTPDLTNILVTIVNLDPYHPQEGWLHIPRDSFGIQPGQDVPVHDLLGDARYTWKEESNYIRLDPAACPAHLFRLR